MSETRVFGLEPEATGTRMSVLEHTGTRGRLETRVRGGTRKAHLGCTAGAETEAAGLLILETQEIGVACEAV